MNHDDLLIEYSDDRRRGERPEIRRALEQLRTLGKCSRCGRPAAAIIGATRAVCRRCCDDWLALTPMERRATRVEWARR